MKNYPLWKATLVILVISLAIIFSLPSLLYKENSNNWFFDNKINLGLDLQGGSYLLLEVQTEVLMQEELNNISDSIQLIARGLQTNIINIISEEDEIQLRFSNNDKLEEIREKFKNNYRNVNVSINNNTMKIVINEIFKKNIKESAIKQSLEIVRKRIDESGTKEPLIQRSGKKRILLQLPGIKDPERIKELLGTTAKLTFQEQHTNLQPYLEQFLFQHYRRFLLVILYSHSPY